MNQYDQTDLDLLRLCGHDMGGPVSWQLDDYLSMAHCDYILRFKRGGDARVRMRLLIRRARDAFRRERGSDEGCPWDDDYVRRPTFDALVKPPQPANVKDFILGFLEKINNARRVEIVEAMTAKGYSIDTVDEALGLLVTENKIHRQSWGNYVFGPKKGKGVKVNKDDKDEPEEAEEEGVDVA